MSSPTDAPLPPPPPPRPYRSLIGGAVVVLLLLMTSAGVKSWSELAAARAHEEELAREIAATESRIRVLREHVRSLGEDPLTLERLAREKLGMVRAGDVVVVLPEPEEAPEPPPPPTATFP